MSKLFDQDTLDNKNIYSEQEIKEGLHTSNDYDSAQNMIDDRSILAPLDEFRRYNSGPEIYENIFLAICFINNKFRLHVYSVAFFNF